MAKIDLSSAYRSVPIHPSCYQLMGLSWQFENDTSPTFLMDTRLCFGASKAPEIFQRLSNCITRFMKRKGFKVISYLDDYLVIDSDEGRCREAHAFLIETLQKLGFIINWKKV